MSYDRIPFGVVEPDTEVLVAAAQTQAFTPGCTLTKKTGALGLDLEVENPSGGGFGAAFDAIVQTAAADAAVDTDWVDTTTRINGIAAPGSHSIQVTDPVLDQVRLRLTSAGNLGVNVRTHWLADKQPTL